MNHAHQRKLLVPSLCQKQCYSKMDNHMKDNKNWHLLVVLSLLTARDVFEEVKLGFLVIGHTHKIIDEIFWLFVKKVRRIK
jgi:hypothetical protein